MRDCVTVYSESVTEKHIHYDIFTSYKVNDNLSMLQTPFPLRTTTCDSFLQYLYINPMVCQGGANSVHHDNVTIISENKNIPCIAMFRIYNFVVSTALSVYIFSCEISRFGTWFSFIRYSITLEWFQYLVDNGIALFSLFILISVTINLLPADLDVAKAVYPIIALHCWLYITS